MLPAAVRPSSHPERRHPVSGRGAGIGVGGVTDRTREIRRSWRHRPYDGVVRLRSKSSAPLLAASVVLLIVLAGCGGTADTGITTGVVTKGTVSETVEAPGTVAAKAVVTVSSPASGTIKTLSVADGARVRKGQTLLVIDSPSARRALKDAKSAVSDASSSGTNLPSNNINAAVAQADDTAEQAFAAAQAAIDVLPAGPAKTQAQVALAQAKAQYATTRAQVTSTNASVNSAIRSLESAVGQLASVQQSQADTAVRSAQRTVDALTVKAPIAGILTFGASGGSSSGGDASGLLSQLPSSLQGTASSLLGGTGGANAPSSSGGLAKGLPASSGQTLLTVTDVAGLSLSAQVDETDVLLVKPGIEADVQLDAVPDGVYAAKVTSVGVTPTTSSRGGVSYIVRLSLGAGRTADDEVAPRPLPGMSAVAQLKVRNDKNVIAVPASAVFRSDGTDAVWLVTDGKAVKRPVKLGAQGADTIGIRAGLAVGDSIVVRGADRVREGQAIP